MAFDVNKINLEINNIDFWSPHSRNKGGMRIYWSADIGCGTLDIVKKSGNNGEDFESPREELSFIALTECMDSDDDKAFTTKLLSLFIEKLNIVD